MSVSILLKLIGVIVEGWGLITEATKQESWKDCRDIKEEYLKDFKTIEHIKLDRLSKIDEVILPFLFEQ